MKLIYSLIILATLLKCGDSPDSNKFSFLDNTNNNSNKNYNNIEKEDSSTESNLIFATNEFELPPCELKVKNQIYYIQSKNIFMYCDGDNYKEIDLMGKDGTNCYDNVGDVNDDGAINILDCKGDKGDAGSDGLEGNDGINCFEITGDSNHDGIIDINDCRGIAGNNGTDGKAGVDGVDGDNGVDGKDCSDMVHVYDVADNDSPYKMVDIVN